MYSVHDRSPLPLQDVSTSAAGTSTSLTYEPFFGLREKAFSLSADARFLFRSPAHGPAFDQLHTGICRREGLIVLTGEIGTGKTTLCRSVVNHLDRRTFAAFVADPFVSREDLLKTLLVDFGVISIGDLTRGRFNGASRSDLSYPLYEFLDSLVPLQAFAVVVIDEAQNLSLPLLEEIRILSELERREKLLQVVLVGQPELRSSLRLPQMRQVDQRVSVRCELKALDAAGVAGYVSYRLRVAARGQSRVELTRGALEAIYEGSSGVPRLINRICDRALQHAFASRSLRLDPQFVWVAIDDLGLIPGAAADAAAPEEMPAEENARPTFVAVPSQTSMNADLLKLDPAELDAARPVLVDLSEEEVEAFLNGTSSERPRTRRKWLTAVAAAASFVAISASVGAPAWYARAQAVEGQALTAQLPAPPAITSFLPVSPAAREEAAPAARGNYSIVVASFTARDRADRLVEELKAAGYAATAIERDAGPERGRFVQVQVGGYTSPLDVQRDLQRIRELPGGYGDARIVERN